MVIDLAMLLIVFGGDDLAKMLLLCRGQHFLVLINAKC